MDPDRAVSDDVESNAPAPLKGQRRLNQGRLLGRMSVTEYEQEFVRLSQYTRECVSTETTMCKRFIK
ncbi:Retrotransposon gag domain-containing 1 [Gossypium australe]|uniref:Retrotransposon gag domain-containing 1 n=1 Tax=Gossypium australe TaxID=47621 RepID=A0A5B6WG47_9ROSI|nr:Retrotransposon gag domain-containing 1 [Gossypium australe]